MSEVFRNVSTCVHGVLNTAFTHVPDGAEFWVPGCYVGEPAKRVMRGHVANDKYPIDPLPPETRRTRSDKGQKRGPKNGQ